MSHLKATQNPDKYFGLLRLCMWTSPLRKRSATDAS